MYTRAETDHIHTVNVQIKKSSIAPALRIICSYMYVMLLNGKQNQDIPNRFHILHAYIYFIYICV